jgi:hypothetical protein
MGFLQEPKQNQSNGASQAKALDVMSAIAQTIPRLKVILGENDRVSNAVNSITANVTGPTLRARAFPSNVDRKFLDVLYELTKLPQATKLWKKDVSDALNDSRFFMMPVELVKERWMSILHYFVQGDKDRFTELLSRLTPPTTAGIVFGVGATSARNEADRKAQLNLRRMAILILSGPQDGFAQNMKSVFEKISELVSASPTSSPSAATRADVFMLCRAVVLKTSAVHLAPLWPIIDSDLRSALLSVLPGSEDFEKYSNSSVIQACKLLDLLVTLGPDDFQLHEWLFVTDTIDAVYRPDNWTPAAIVDSIAENITTASDEEDGDSLHGRQTQSAMVAGSSGKRRPILSGIIHEFDSGDLKAMQKQDLASRVLRQFFGQLSLSAFEATYEMSVADVQLCVDELLEDMFEDGDM